MSRLIALLLSMLLASTSAHSPPKYMSLILLYIEEGVASASETCAKRFPNKAVEWSSAVASWRESNKPRLDELRKLRESVEAKAAKSTSANVNNVPGINTLTLQFLRTTMHARSQAPMSAQPDLEAQQYCDTTHSRLLDAPAQRELLENARREVLDYLRKN